MALFRIIPHLIYAKDIFAFSHVNIIGHCVEYIKTPTKMKWKCNKAKTKSVANQPARRESIKSTLNLQ